jgi:hypothetical protein
VARWIDVRVPADQSASAMRVLLEAFVPVTFELDTDPPAAGPEHALSVQDQREPDVRRVLEANGVSVLAIRTRLDRPMEVGRG